MDTDAQDDLPEVLPPLRAEGVRALAGEVPYTDPDSDTDGDPVENAVVDRIPVLASSSPPRRSRCVWKEGVDADTETEEGMAPSCRCCRCKGDCILSTLWPRPWVPPPTAPLSYSAARDRGLSLLPPLLVRAADALCTPIREVGTLLGVITSPSCRFRPDTRGGDDELLLLLLLLLLLPLLVVLKLVVLLVCG